MSSMVLWILITLLMAFVVLSITLRRDAIETDPPEEKAIPVHIQRVVRRPVEHTIRLPGRIEADFRSRLAVDKGGRVTELLVDKGDTVMENQLLLRIENRVWQALLKQAEIEEREARREFERWSELVETGAVSASDFDAIRTRFDRARVQLADAEVHVAQCEVRSPVNGIINARFVEVGEFAAEGSAVLELVVTDPVRVRINVPEREIATAVPGRPLPFSVAVLGDNIFKGKITHVAEAASLENNSFRVEATLPNPDRILRPGMIATAKWTRPRMDEAVVIPLSAIIPHKGEHFVFIAREDRAVRRLVRIERFLDTEAVLSTGLEPGEEVVVEGHRELIDGALIQRVPMEGRS